MAIPTVEQLASGQKDFQHKAATWLPLACARHAGLDPDNPVPANQRGFTKSCPGCVQQAKDTLAHALAAVGP